MTHLKVLTLAVENIWLALHFLGSLFKILYEVLYATIKSYKTASYINHPKGAHINITLHPYQHGFLRAKSCLTDSLCFVEDITTWLDEGSPVYIIYLYVHKPSDKVIHKR